MKFLIGIISIAAILILQFGVASAAIVPQCAPNCTVCDLLKLVQNIINFLTEISVPIAVAAILAGGITILTAGSSQKRLELGKTIFTNAIVGFAIVMGSWLIINTILNALGASSVLPWNTIQC